MSSIKDYLLKLQNYYSKNCSEKEFHSQVKWGSKFSQFRRFEVLFEIEGIDNGSSVLDYGCGNGALYEYIENSDLELDYHGYDLLDEMIKTASERFLDGKFFQFIPKKEFDFVVASGIFTLMDINSVEKTIHEMFLLCNKGLAFNCLSEWSNKKEEDEFYHDPVAIFNICASMTKKIALRHDYFPHDFTIYMYK